MAQLFANDGKDVEERFIPIFTFYDNEEPQALEAVKAAGIPFYDWFAFKNTSIWKCKDD